MESAPKLGTELSMRPKLCLLGPGFLQSLSPAHCSLKSESVYDRLHASASASASENANASVYENGNGSAHASGNERVNASANGH